MAAFVIAFNVVAVAFAFAIHRRSRPRRFDPELARRVVRSTTRSGGEPVMEIDDDDLDPAGIPAAWATAR